MKVGESTYPGINLVGDGHLVRFQIGHCLHPHCCLVGFKEREKCVHAHSQKPEHCHSERVYILERKSFEESKNIAEMVIRDVSESGGSLMRVKKHQWLITGKSCGFE